jgi:hypothetical protein
VTSYLVQLLQELGAGDSITRSELLPALLFITSAAAGPLRLSILQLRYCCQSINSSTTAIMIVDAFEEVLRKTSAIPLPTASPTGVAPIPTVVPDHAEKQFVGETGTKTLWVVFIIMLISSGVFSGLAWRVPVVCNARDQNKHQPANSLAAKAPLLCHHDFDHHHCCDLLLRHGCRRGCFHPQDPRP